MAIDYEFILLGFGVGSLVWAICRAIGYVWQVTRVPLGFSE